ncbi:MAG: hypothetical protein HBSAPP03_24050 [Phycisphaerae bacterium]|nr:MAG: hypothetical protein HBSAPP03_24050 [Phycisphaerae bacterium]
MDGVQARAGVVAVHPEGEGVEGGVEAAGEGEEGEAGIAEGFEDADGDDGRGIEDGRFFAERVGFVGEIEAALAVEDAGGIGSGRVRGEFWDEGIKR